MSEPEIDTQNKQESVRSFRDERKYSTNFRVGRKYAVMTSDDYLFHGEIRGVSSYDILLVGADFVGCREDVIALLHDANFLEMLATPSDKYRHAIRFMTIPKSKISFSICIS